MPELYRKRLIPSECIHLKNDTIVSISDGHIITRWKTLHPKEEFSYGISYYVVKHGWKISKFYKENGTLAYIYCDIIDTSYDKNTDTYIFTDLLADVIIENDGFVRVVDLDELAEECQKILNTAQPENPTLTIWYAPASGLWQAQSQAELPPWEWCFTCTM